MDEQTGDDGRVAAGKTTRVVKKNLQLRELRMPGGVDDEDNILVHMHIIYLTSQLVYGEQFLQSVIFCFLERKNGSGYAPACMLSCE